MTDEAIKNKNLFVMWCCDVNQGLAGGMVLAGGLAGIVERFFRFIDAIPAYAAL
ncbi:MULTISPECIES: hypothetical protein [unclassified Chromobacterium]|uniref:hypothetical protein n=1 Tax=unclassified Chromobacterium TaxID=2641838 RepID=UPI0012E1BF3A|nr:hypothetical protein [Chromobacterium sp. LK1]